MLQPSAPREEQRRPTAAARAAPRLSMKPLGCGTELHMVRRLGVALSLLAALSGCDSTAPSRACICTAEFVTIRYTVLNPLGAVETGVATTVTQMRTHAVLISTPADSSGPYYPVIDDSFRGRIEPRGDSLEVTGTKNSMHYLAHFVVGVDEPCECHVYKIAGPDTVRLQ